jgi:TRAP-type uncharacterized transport system fused permease subunit
VVPFTFVYGPELLWDGPLWQTAITFITGATGLILLTMAIEEYKPVCAEWWGRILVGVAGLCMIMPFFISTFAGSPSRPQLPLRTACGSGRGLALGANRAQNKHMLVRYQ